jgi:hypothetical protein
VIWIRLGNCSTADTKRRKEIDRFVVDEDATFLALG